MSIRSASYYITISKVTLITIFTQTKVNLKFTLTTVAVGLRLYPADSAH